MTCPVCGYQFHQFYASDPPDLQGFMEHIAAHVAELAKRAPPRYECPDHPDASVIIHNGMFTWATCNWTRQEGRKVVEWCGRKLEKVPI